MIVFIYIIGKNISVYGIDVSAYVDKQIDAQGIFLQLLSGDYREISLFILGLFPYMTASIIVIFYMAIRSLDKNVKLAPDHATKATLVFTLIIGVIQAFQKVREFKYLEVCDNLLTRVIVFIELIAGMLFVIYVCDRSVKYGIGGRSVIFLVNIYDGLFAMIKANSWDAVKLPLVIGMIEAVILVFLDNTEKRIPVLRVSIHSLYADKNYIAYKFVPVGVMPLMFSSAFYALFQIIVRVLVASYPENSTLVFVSENMSMNQLLGMIVYIAAIWLVNITFAFVMLRPGSMAESLRKSGDSLENIHAGKRTTLYLIGCVLRLSIYSSIVFSIFAAIPFVLCLYGYMDSSLMLFSNSIMMSTGLWLMFFREAQVYINYEKYKTFI